MKPLNPQPTEQAPHTIDNYPYSFYKCLKKYWVETTKRGQRLVTQTQNPKTQRWNTPKKSNYDQIIIIGIDETTGHTTHRGLSTGYRTEEEAKAFYERYSSVFSEYQNKEYKGVLSARTEQQETTAEAIEVFNRA
jgi:hypothetical protein